MQYISRKKFGKRTAITALILCVILQAVCAVAEYLINYFTGGEGIGDTADVVISLVLEFFRTASVFSSYAIIAYIVFIHGLGGGGEWLLCEITGTAVVVVLTVMFADLTFGLIASLITAVILASILFVWIKNGKGVYLVLLLALAVPFFSGIASLYSVPSVHPSTETLFSALLYSILDRCVNLLLLTVAARTASAFRDRAIRNNDGICDISVSGRFLPKKNPLLKSLAVIDIIFFLYAMFQASLEVINLINSYGSPETASDCLTIASYFTVPTVYLLLGYVIMWLVAYRLEVLFVRSEDEADAISAGRNRA